MKDIKTGALDDPTKVAVQTGGKHWYQNNINAIRF